MKNSTLIILLVAAAATLGSILGPGLQEIAILTAVSLVIASLITRSRSRSASASS